jgi:DNA invertase Pin-like site-specific DNA recombinase
MVKAFTPARSNCRMLAKENSAAQYLRMSTDMQRYSLENQSEGIALYAARRGLTIVRSYEDAGRSGLRLDGRAGLQNLLGDVRSGRAEFGTILVYDVTRWGRFQDSDESAYYEFLCKDAGVKVEYCAEQFENDGSLTATVLKNIKRAMAGEFSRELSTKVFAGQRRIVASGFHIGSTPGFGLRRHLLDVDGNRKMELTFGQRKSLQGEHVILVPGPADEIRIVHQVYDLFIDQKETLRDIATTLNARGVLNEFGRAWTPMVVRGLLSNEKYIGNAVYNRTSKKLDRNWRRNPRAEWVRSVGAYEAIVSPQRFQQAQTQLKANARVSTTDNEMLDVLSALWCSKRSLSRNVIDASTHAPSSRAYIERFGGLTHAYHRIGYARRDDIRKNAAMRKAIMKDVAERVARSGGTVKAMPRNCQLLINGELTVNVLVSRPVPRGPGRWRFGHLSLQKPDILLVARVDRRSDSIKDYFVLPFLFIPYGSWVTVSGFGASRLDGFRSDTLMPFHRLCARQQLGAS